MYIKCFKHCAVSLINEVTENALLSHLFPAIPNLKISKVINAYKFRKIIGKNDFSYHFKNIIVRYKKLGYDIDVLRQTACLVVNPIKIYNFAYLFDCTTVSQASD